MNTMMVLAVATVWFCTGFICGYLKKTHEVICKRKAAEEVKRAIKQINESMKAEDSSEKE